jgi:hypothetical protein
MFDFYKEFLGVDLAKVEAIAELVGKIYARVRVGMIAGGLTEDQADDALRIFERELLRAITDMKPPA